MCWVWGDGAERERSWGRAGRGLGRAVPRQGEPRVGASVRQKNAQLLSKPALTSIRKSLVGRLQFIFFLIVCKHLCDGERSALQHSSCQEGPSHENLWWPLPPQSHNLPVRGQGTLLHKSTSGEYLQRPSLHF